MASVRSIDDALSITLNTNGRVLRNLIHGADTVMSHILHFYHLSAADFVDVSALGSPWDDGTIGNPAFGVTTGIAALVPLTTVNTLPNRPVTGQLVESYVAALNARKECHTMGAIFSGRQPIQNALVPGGVSTLFNQSDIDLFRVKLQGIRNFINAYYIPDVVFVATRTNPAWTTYWTVGTSPGQALSYGDYPSDVVPFTDVTNDNMLITRGIAHFVDHASNPTFEAFDTNKIREDVEHSYYADSTSGKHPSVGVTSPLTGTVLSAAMTAGTKYSWLKAPRYNDKPAEVGPLARMVVTYLSVAGGNGPLNTMKVTEAGGPNPANSLGTFTGISLSSPYSAVDLVDYALTAANAVAGLAPGFLKVGHLFSPLGRHAARALEAKLVADAMYSWLDELSLDDATDDNALGSKYPHPYTTGVKTGHGYTYVKIPKNVVYGEGLAEAPRGALGHWIKISSKKVANYQCVVPTTWNACPADANGVAGPAEQVVEEVNVGTGNNAICNIARLLHPYDFCIACAVHVVTPEGKDVARFEIGLDGKTRKLPMDSK